MKGERSNEDRRGRETDRRQRFDRRFKDRGAEARGSKDLTEPPSLTNAPLTSGGIKGEEQCAHILQSEGRFCGFFFAKHVGSFQHEFVRPPLWTPESECSNCHATAGDDVILKAAVINGEAAILCNKPGCFKTASTIRLRVS